MDPRKVVMGYAARSPDGIDIRTVSATILAAKINYLVACARVMVFEQFTDEDVDALWHEHAPDSVAIIPVTVEAVGTTN